MDRDAATSREAVERMEFRVVELRSALDQEGTEVQQEGRQEIQWAIEHGTSDSAKAVRELRKFMCCQAGREMVDVGLIRPFLHSLPYVPEAALQEAERERDLAIAHDRQPYPTADAYEKACAALEKHRDRAEAAEARALSAEEGLREMRAGLERRANAAYGMRDEHGVATEPYNRLHGKGEAYRHAAELVAALSNPEGGEGSETCERCGGSRQVFVEYGKAPCGRALNGRLPGNGRDRQADPRRRPH